MKNYKFCNCFLEILFLLHLKSMKILIDKIKLWFKEKDIMNNTIVYLIRHSEKFESENIGIYNSSDSKQVMMEKKMLSVEGEAKAKKLSEEDEFKNIDYVYCSNYVRAMQTAKYFIEGKNIKLNIDERFNERKIGDSPREKYPNLLCDQHWNKEIKGENGESQSDVNARMTEAFWEVVNNNKYKKNVIVSHRNSDIISANELVQVA